MDVRVVHRGSKEHTASIFRAEEKTKQKTKKKAGGLLVLDFLKCRKKQCREDWGQL
jgi:hypothetical protein